ncbi:solute carrier family 13 member 3-like isoform X2 [Chiloscyllium plagiosum]|uniref:solute carrier family 13 member 3-like isoform X2 n=1 Tax=Chiloscyllium plagiosum TaxID=36176 RepID=UPI001CB80724|nr:solute carrier family 13 member 3-like isoform X2 [Chiloscyllium plagiosum]
MEKIAVIAKKVWCLRKSIVVCLAPLVFSPILFTTPPKEGRCLYVILLMAMYWCTEALPIAVTSLLPMSLFPLLGILPSSKVCPQYFLDTNALFLSGLIMALAIEEWNLHRRIALAVLLFVGLSPSMLILGMMITTCFLSMWLSNTATTAMMMPIANAVLQSLFGSMEVTPRSGKIKGGLDTKDNTSKESLPNETSCFISDDSSHPQKLETDVSFTPVQQRKEKESQKRLWKGFLVCIPYAASIGGTATLTGTAPNLLLLGQLKTYFPGCNMVNFASWFMFCCPVAILFLFAGWLWIAFLYGGLNPRSWSQKKTNNTESQARVRARIRSDYEKLGPLTFAECAVLVFFAFFVVLLLTRDPKFIPGWASIFPKGYVSDAVTGMTFVFALCFFPSQKPSLKWWFDPKASGKMNPPLLNWKKIQKDLPWNVVLLLGGGFAIAKGCETSGLSIWIGNQLQPMVYIKPTIAIILICLLITCFTEFASNTATIVIMLPIVAELALHMRVNPLYLMVPATVAGSYAFMLPISTPPNSIAFATGNLKVIDMVKSGIIMNFLGIFLLLLAINTWGLYVFELSTYPDWARIHTHSTQNVTMISLNGTM